jgi:hypothetical protein
MADPVTMKLRKPIPWGKDGSEPITELVIQPMKPKYLRNIPPNASAEDKGLLLLGRLTGQPPGVIDELDMADYEEASTIAAGFLSSQETGTRSLQ